MLTKTEEDRLTDIDRETNKREKKEEVNRYVDR